MEPAELDRDLAAGALKPVYLLYGQEVLLREQHLKRLAGAVAEGLGEFNFESLLADEISPGEVLERARTLPFLKPPRVIILRGVDRYEALEAAVFLDYLAEPAETTSLVLVADQPDFRQKLFKTLQAQGLAVGFTPPRGRALLARLKEMAAREGRELTPAAAEVLVEQMGSDLMGLAGELEKICLFAGEKTRLDVEEVQAAARLGRAANVFELGDAIGEQDPGKALAALKEVLMWDNPPRPRRGKKQPKDSDEDEDSKSRRRRSESRDPIQWVLYMLIRHFRLLWQAKLLLPRRVGRAEAAKELGVPAFAAGKYLSQARGLSLPELKKGLARLLEANLTLVTSRAPARLVMESLVLDLARLRAGSRSAEP